MTVRPPPCLQDSQALVRAIQTGRCSVTRAAFLCSTGTATLPTRCSEDRATPNVLEGRASCRFLHRSTTRLPSGHTPPIPSVPYRPPFSRGSSSVSSGPVLAGRCRCTGRIIKQSWLGESVRSSYLAGSGVRSSHRVSGIGVASSSSSSSSSTYPPGRVPPRPGYGGGRRARSFARFQGMNDCGYSPETSITPESGPYRPLYGARK